MQHIGSLPLYSVPASKCRLRAPVNNQLCADWICAANGPVCSCNVLDRSPASPFQVRAPYEYAPMEIGLKKQAHGNASGHDLVPLLDEPWAQICSADLEEGTSRQHFCFKPDPDLWFALRASAGVIGTSQCEGGQADSAR